MQDFDYSRLRRFPDVEAPNLFAYDATDRLLVERAQEFAAGQGISGPEIAIIGDEYGAITIPLTAAGFGGIRVHQDLATGRRALAKNAEDFGLDGFVSAELDESLLAGARLVLLQLPKSLAELEEIADAVARFAAPNTTLIAGGRVKHMTLSQNEILGSRFSEVRAERAVQKSRLIWASLPLAPQENPPFPQVAHHPEISRDGLWLAAHGATFAGNRIDIGTRVLLDVFARLPERDRVLDLGCGSGALAAAYARANPAATVIATDRSAASVASATETMRRNGVSERVTVTHDDAGSEIADASIDLVLLNPPFHLGSSVHSGAATRLFEAAARVLKPGGELWTVFNSSLGYRRQLGNLIGPTEQVDRTSKFTVTRSFRR